jgi:glycosyltransferase involved in cell wall biosynthesis
MISRLRPLLKGVTRALGIEVKRHRPKFLPGVVSLRPEGTPRGIVLLAYILEPFQRRHDTPVSTSHTHHEESLLIAETWLKHGYSVDVIDYRNHEFIPQKHYDFFISARTHLETIAARLDVSCVKIAHLDTSHYAFNNQAAYARVLALARRRGTSLPSIRLIEHNRAIECADYGVVFGSEFVIGTYSFAGKPLFAIPVPATVTHPSPAGKNMDACRNSFLWFGSSGLVHKGLDLVLEAFAGMPDMKLTVCGPISSDHAFGQLYRTELYHTPHIRTAGWVDSSGSEFRDIVRSCVAVIFPSCAEAQAGSVINCMRAGLIPMVTRETGIPVGDFGVTLENASVEEIRRAVRRLVALTSEELQLRAQRAWDYAAAHHSHEAYREAYGQIVQKIITDSAKQSMARNR